MPCLLPHPILWALSSPPGLHSTPQAPAAAHFFLPKEPRLATPGDQQCLLVTPAWGQAGPGKDSQWKPGNRASPCLRLLATTMAMPDTVRPGRVPPPPPKLFSGRRGQKVNRAQRAIPSVTPGLGCFSLAEQFFQRELRRGGGGPAASPPVAPGCWTPRWQIG